MLCHYCMDCQAYDNDSCQSPFECEHPWDCENCSIDCPAFEDMYGAVTSDNDE